ncbi:MAG: hypothetical protein PUC73_10805 [Lachnospiraceae bacterium]|nr:hypothetical protein [Lachnospiraceae bacterium]
MEQKIFSRCGMRCDLCLIYRPNVEREDRRAEICKKLMEAYSCKKNMDEFRRNR